MYASSRSQASSCDISIASDATRVGDSVTLNLKLFAVSDTRQKLIGLVNMPIDWKSPDYKDLSNQSIKFSKCIDSNASIEIST